MSDSTLSKVQNIMRDVFDDETIELTNETTAADVEEWDSMNHVRLIVAIEQDLGVQLSNDRVNDLANVGELVALIDSIQG